MIFTITLRRVEVGPFVERKDVSDCSIFLAPITRLSDKYTYTVPKMLRMYCCFMIDRGKAVSSDSPVEWQKACFCGFPAFRNVIETIARRKMLLY